MTKKSSLVVVFGIFLASTCLLAAAGREPSPTSDDGKAPLVESGYVTKTDLKKKILTVQGSVSSLPEQLPGQRSGSPGNRRNVQYPGGGGRGGGGRSGGGSGRDGGGRSAGANDNPIREFKVYITADTVILQEKTTLTLDDIHVSDFVMVVGTPKGKSGNVDASSISVSDR